MIFLAQPSATLCECIGGNVPKIENLFTHLKLHCQYYYSITITISDDFKLIQAFMVISPIAMACDI